MSLDESNIIHQGWLKKKSKHLHFWHRRWTILTAEHLITYKDEEKTEKATEIIPLRSISGVVSDSITMFHVDGGRKIEFEADSYSDKTQWIYNIHKYQHYCVNVPVFVEYCRGNEYNCNFDMNIPFDKNYPYSVHAFISDIMIHIHKQFNPFLFIPLRVSDDSFIEMEINHDDSEWQNLTANIIDYV
eukprot:282926_1